MADADRRHGCQSRSTTFHGFTEPVVLDWDSTVTREVVVCPANHPAHAAVELLAEALEQGAGLCPLAIDLGSMASPRMAPWAAPGVHLMARPWPHVGPLCAKDAFTLDCASRRVTGPQRQTVSMVPGRDAQVPAAAGAACAVRAQCTTAKLGHGSSLRLREDEPCQPKLRAKSKTTRGRAARWQRTAVEPAISHPWAHQGRRARSKGRRQNQGDGRRHTAVSNIQVAARYAEERQLAS